MIILMSTSYKEVISCLKRLIETHDFVVIPQFGAFIMQMEAAEFSVSQSIIFPPRKKILFNPLLTYNDGLLVSEIQKTSGIENVLAQTLVQQFVEGLKILLNTKRRADLEGIGFFYKDLNDNILFESELNPFYLSESYGLYPVSAIPVENQTDTFVSHSLSSKNTIRFEPKNIYKAAVVLLVISLFFVYWWISPVDIRTQWANVIGTKPSIKIKVSAVYYPFINNRYDRYNVMLRKEVKEYLKMHVNGNVVSKENKLSVFSIVLGCFKVEQNAHKLIKDMRSKNVEASLKWNAEKQMYIVYIGNFADKLKATSVLSDLKSKGVLKDAWIKEEK